MIISIAGNFSVSVIHLKYWISDNKLKRTKTNPVGSEPVYNFMLMKLGL